MKLSEMKSNQEVVAEQLRTDPEFRVAWERTALARGVAVALVRHRAEHDLTQRDLAKRLQMKQPQVARLELGEINPSMDTLMRIASRLSIEFTIDVRPVHSPAPQHHQARADIGRRGHVEHPRRRGPRGHG
jgi:ribosome-binding protein aMBF1 (putative translation factor)